MNNAIILRLVALLFVAMPIQNNALAEQAIEFGNYMIQYNALTSDNLSPTVADAHKLKRSRNYMMLNIVVQEQGNVLPLKTVQADVKARATNLWGQVKDIEMLPVREGEVVYYIGQTKIVDEETLRFSVDIRPENSPASHNLEFQQQFFIR